jgi:hypothetical protein
MHFVDTVASANSGEADSFPLKTGLRNRRLNYAKKIKCSFYKEVREPWDEAARQWRQQPTSPGIPG